MHLILGVFQLIVNVHEEGSGLLGLSMYLGTFFKVADSVVSNFNEDPSHRDRRLSKVRLKLQLSARKAWDMVSEN